MKSFNKKNCLLKNLENNYHLYIFGIFVIAFLIRVAYAYLFADKLSPDAQNYYSAAINIVNGNGYSICTEEPYSLFYFREPLTSYTIALVIWLYKIVTSTQSFLIPTDWAMDKMATYHHHIIFGVKILSIILQVFSLYLFTKIVRKRSSSLIALCFFAISAVYVPLIMSNNYILREPYVFFFLSLMVYYWDKYLDSTNIIHLLPVAIFNGILCLYLQSYWLLGCLFLVFIAIRLRREYKKVFLHLFAYVSLFICSIAPHLYQVYQYYPDIRIVKNMGSALSFEYVDALNAYRAHGADPYGAKQGDLPNNAEVHPEIFSIIDAHQVFEYTFNGTYENEANRLNSLNTSSKRASYSFNKKLLSFRNTVFIVGITYDYGIFLGHFSSSDIVKFIFVLPYLIFGILALFGLWYFIKKFWMLGPVFFFHAGLFFVFGSEERRQIVLVPYIICLAFITLYYLYKKYKGVRRISNE